MSSAATLIERPPAPAATAPSRRPRWVLSPRRRSSAPLVIVLLLTALSAFLRFSSLGQPTLWGDEAAVFWRTCGSYRQLLDILQNDGFVPLHYELYWVISRFARLTPEVMRIPTATAAVLMVPVMYFLARQLVGRRAAVAAALLTAVSGHIAWYAHDAKMYMPFWMLCALNVACLLWWFRCDRRIAWWAWVASGLAMAGYHATGMLLLAIEPLFLLTRPGLRWRHTLLFLAGLTVIGAGPAGYYLGFNRWTKNIEQRGWEASGIAWVDTINRGQSAGDLATATGHQLLLGFGFPQAFPPARPDTRMTQALNACLGAAGIALLLGLVPWPTRRRGRGEPVPPQPPWRSTLWIAAWLLLPTYAFYAASFADYLWPTQLLERVIDAIRPQDAKATAGVCAVAALSFYWCGTTWRQRVARLAQLLLVIGTLLALGSAIAYGLRRRPPGQLWVLRYLGFVWPALIIAIAALFTRLPGRVLPCAAVALLAGLNLAHSVARVQFRQDMPLDLLVRDVLQSPGDGSPSRTCCLGSGWGPAIMGFEGRYYLYALSGRPMIPAEWWRGDLLNLFHIWQAPAPRAVADAMTAAPAVTRLIVWDMLPPNVNEAERSEALASDKDPLTPLLVGWTRRDVQLHTFYSRWHWTIPGTWRRREYTRPPASTQPAAAAGIRRLSIVKVVS